MTLTRRGQFWHYRFRFRGIEFSGSTKLTSHRDAKAYEDQFKARLALGEVGLAPFPTMRTAWDSWKAQAAGRVSQGHLDRAESAWRLHLAPTLANLRADQVTSDVVSLVRQKYLDGATKRKHGGKARTAAGANTMLGYLRALLLFVKRQFPALRMPDVPMPRPQEPVRSYVPRAGVRAFLAAVDRTSNLHQSVAIRAMLFLGLREGEALSMRWEWFGPRLQTYTPGRTKGREALPLPVPAELRVFLHALGPADLGLVLPAEDGKPHRAQFTRKAIQRAGLKGLSPHRLRTSCATLLSQAGTPLKVVQRQLRHRDIRTTARYVEVGLADLIEASDRTWAAQISHGDQQDTA